MRRITWYSSFLKAAGGPRYVFKFLLWLVILVALRTLWLFRSMVVSNPPEGPRPGGHSPQILVESGADSGLYDPAHRLTHGACMFTASAREWVTDSTG
jgi:hypothetical protein